MRLKALTGVGDAPEDIVGCAFAAPLAPLVAARLEGVAIDAARLVAGVEALSERHGVTLVEGAGGLIVPLADDYTIADLAAALALPVLVVARPGLGTVNHTALTVSVARSLGLDVVGVVLNGAGPETDASVFTNTELIETFAAVPVLGVTPWLDGELDAERVMHLVIDHLDLAAIRSRIGDEAA